MTTIDVRPISDAGLLAGRTALRLCRGCGFSDDELVTAIVQAVRNAEQEPAGKWLNGEFVPLEHHP